MTPEQIEKKLKETADMIEEAVKDFNENKATKQEVLDLIEDHTKVDHEMLNAHKESLEEVNNGMTEAKQAIDELKKQLKLVRSGRSTVQQGDNSKYNGYFSSPQEAKTFALLVMHATTVGTKVAERFDWAKKQLDSMGIDPYYITEAGQKAMVGSSQSAGGALVLVEQVPSIITLLETYGKFRANALNMPMGAGETIMPKTDGLLTMSCVGEGGTMSETEPAIPVIALTPKTLSGITAYSLELGDDSLVALGEMLAGLFARSCAYYEDLCGFLGNGKSEYFSFKGIVGALMGVNATIGNIKSLVVGSGNAYSELTLDDFEKVPGTLPDFADDGDAKWYCHRYFYWTVMIKLALTSTAIGSEIIIGANTRQKQFLGYPVEFTQVMPKAEANSQICALLANLRQGAILGTRGGIEVAQSAERYFDKGLIGVRCRDRIAINVHGVGDITKAGPICGLITADS